MYYPIASFRNPLTGLVSRVLHALRQLSPFHYKAGTVPPQEANLEGMRRVFMAPYAAGPIVFSWLKHDPNFLGAIPKVDGEYLIRFCVVGDELRVNFHRVEEATLQQLQENPLLSPIHDHNWHRNGMFHYFMSRDLGVMHVIRDMPGRHYCDIDVLVSYARPLTQDEHEQLENMRMKQL